MMRFGSRTLALSRGAPDGPRDRRTERRDREVIFASSLGTVFEWYDFYLYGSLAPIISRQFFSGVNETTAFIFALLAFAAGFAVRPFGAILFGRLGDLIGRKYTFLVTILIMGLSTAVVGMLPTYSQIGMLSPIVLVTLRLLQGLALGGEYGGAATYVAEHAPAHKRGLFTSFIQCTATLGLLLSLLVILICRQWLGRDFDEWGWRIPFRLSVVLLIISIYIRLHLAESPVFRRMKDAGTCSRAPLTESFARWGNLRIVILVMLGGTAGQAVVWYMYGDIHLASKTVNHPAAAGTWSVSGAQDVDGNGYSDIVWNDMATDNTRATLMGGPSSLVSSTVLNSNFNLASSSNAFHLIASTGGG